MLFAKQFCSHLCYMLHTPARLSRRDSSSLTLFLPKTGGGLTSH